MPIIFVCSVPFSGGERLAKILAQKLGYAYLSREDVVARANEAGIPVGKLEVAMVKKPAVQERMARLKDRYLAVATATICEQGQEENLVYYGRAGHHLLPGVSHVMRVHVLPEHGQRIENVMARLKLSREKTEKFLQDIDGDIRAWVRFVHGIDMDDARKYDFVLNLERMSLDNAASALCSMAEMPDFRATPASRLAFQDRLLQAQARIRLALDEQMGEADLTVRANLGVVTITYVPRQAHLAARIPALLQDLPGCREIRCTMASTNILWVQEDFEADSEAFRQVNELARRWGAAVELLQYRCEGEEADGGNAPSDVPASPAVKGYTGGVEDDVPEAPTSLRDKPFHDTLVALVREGRSGGGQTICGTREKLLSAINPTIKYSLIAVGGLFLQRPPGPRTRMTRELSDFLARRLKAPVVSTQELGEQLRLGPKQWLQFGSALALVVAGYVFMFTHQDQVVNILGGAYHKEHPWAAPVAVAVVAPLVAGIYGLVAGLLLKAVRME